MPYHPLYRVWRGMRNRCENPNDDRWKDYGGRGIRVCRAWRSSITFFKWAIPHYEQGLQIERRNNDLGYRPSNCYWATPKQQNRNRRSNRVLTFKGKRKTLVEWSECTGIPEGRLWMRLKNGWSVEDALTIKGDGIKCMGRVQGLTFNGETRRLHEWCKILKISRCLIRWRLGHGWSVEEALSRRPDRRKKLFGAGKRLVT